MSPIKFHFIAPYVAEKEAAGVETMRHKRQGVVKLYVLNHRKRVIFRMMRGLSARRQVAASGLLTFPNLAGEPTNGHLSIAPAASGAATRSTQHESGAPGDFRSAVMVHWNVGAGVKDGGLGQRVRYGVVSGQLLNQSLVSRRASYGRSDMCGGAATAQGFRDAGLHLSAVMSGLVPGQRVFYRYGSDDDGWSDEASFVAPYTPPPFTGRDWDGDGEWRQRVGEVETRIFAFGDLGQYSPDGAFQHCNCEAAQRTTDAMLRLVQAGARRLDNGGGAAGAHAILHIGDVSYARGYAAEWESFMNMIEPVARRVPWMTAVGNHERDWPQSGSVVGFSDSGGECGVPYRHYFPMPSPTPLDSSADSPWYSFEEGLVHVAVLSSEHEAQVEWLERDLSMVRRGVTPWVVVALHRPMYFTGIDTAEPLREGAGYDYEVADKLREAYEAVLVKYGVDLVLAGHHHSYQRTCPIFNNSCSGDQHPVHLVVGMAGYQNSPILEPASRNFDFVDSRHHGLSRLVASRQKLLVEYLVPRVQGQGWPRHTLRVDPECDCAILDSFTLSAKTGV